MGNVKITELEYLKRKQYFENQLKQNNKIKLKLIWAVFVTLVGTFLMPFMKAGDRWSRETFSTTMGYENSVLLFGGFMIPIMSYLIYSEYKNMIRKKFDIERDLRLLEKEYHKQ
ncbi:hypothetical protein CDW55_04690 [Chryseobacterium sp. VAUSW3]|nr:hypothetical protein CDW55_04690 [Chryseobacterium sp. VAUSW3]